MKDCQSSQFVLRIKILMFRKSGSLVKLWSSDGLPKLLCAARSVVPDGSNDLPCLQLVCVVVIVSLLR